MSARTPAGSLPLQVCENFCGCVQVPLRFYAWDPRSVDEERGARARRYAPYLPAVCCGAASCSVSGVSQAVEGGGGVHSSSSSSRINKHENFSAPQRDVIALQKDFFILFIYIFLLVLS